MNYQGDYLEDATVYIPFNTFSSDDPSASITITDLISSDVEIWKDGVIQTTPGAGVTLTLNIGTGNGSHLIAVDTSNVTDGGFYVTGADYQVRINGTTVDGATINAWVGTFSIENRFKEVTVTSMAAGVIANATFNADVGSTAHGSNIIALAVRKILEELNLDHLLKITTGVAADGELEPYVVAGTVLAHIMAAGADATAFKASTDSLEAVKVHADTIKAETSAILTDTGEIGTAGAGLSNINLPNQTMNITGDLSGSVGSVSADVTTDSASRTASKAGAADVAGAEVDVTKIHGSALTEGVSGYLAAAFVKLFDVATPLLVASDVMVGTDNAATETKQDTAQADLNIITGTSGVLIDTDAVDADALKADAVTKIWAKTMSDLAQGAPSATASVLTAINYLYEAWRNKTLTTATLITMMKDDRTTAAVKSIISDDGTTFVKEEFISGA